MGARNSALVSCLQDGHFNLLTCDEPLIITRLLAAARRNAQEHGTTEPLVYPVEWPERRYAVHCIDDEDELELHPGSSMPVAESTSSSNEDQGMAVNTITNSIT